MVDCDSERIWKIVETNRLNVPRRQRPASAPLSLFDRLYDCYVDCKQNALDKSFDKRFRNTVNLLGQLEPGHVTPSLVVSLYSDERGYSLTLCPRQGTESEEIFIPYEDNEIFSYLDNQEIPPVVLEVLEQTQYCHMHSWCVVCEVRDYRSSSNQQTGYDKHLLLLRPTTETVMAAVNQLARDCKCSPEEELWVESRVLLATQPPVCLDPSTDVVCVTNRLQFNQRKFNTPAMRRYLRRRSQASRSRMHVSSQAPAPDGLGLHDFIASSAPPATARRDFSSSWKRRKIEAPLSSSLDAVCEEVLRCAAGRLLAPMEPQAGGATPPSRSEQPSRLPAPSQPHPTGLADELLSTKPPQSTPTPPPPSHPSLPPPSQPSLPPQPPPPSLLPQLPLPTLPPPPSQSTLPPPQPSQRTLPPPPSQLSHIHQATPTLPPMPPKMKPLQQQQQQQQQHLVDVAVAPVRMPPSRSKVPQPPIVMTPRSSNRPIAPAPPKWSAAAAIPMAITAITQAITNPTAQGGLPKLNFLSKATPTLAAPPLPSSSAPPTMPVLHKIPSGSNSKAGAFAGWTPPQSAGQVVRSQGGGAVVMVTRSSQGQVGLVSVQVKPAAMPQATVITAMPSLTPGSNVAPSLPPQQQQQQQQPKGKRKK